MGDLQTKAGLGRCLVLVAAGLTAAAVQLFGISSESHFARADEPPASKVDAPSAAPPTASPAAPAGKPDPAKLAERERLKEEIPKLSASGKIDEAIEMAQQLLAVEQELFGDEHAEVAGAWELLAELFQQQEQWDNMADATRQLLAIQTKLSGPDDWHVTDARLRLRDADVYKSLSPDARAELRRADELNTRLWQRYQAGHAADALEAARQELEIRRKILGEAHPDYAYSVHNLALMYQSTGDYKRAELLYRQAIEVRKKILGEAHPLYAMSLSNLALVYRASGDFLRAEPLLRQALEIRKKALGETHPNYATSVNALALLYQSMGKYAQAEPLFRQALKIRKEALGEADPDYAASLNNLATFYYSMGDYAQAEPLYHQALDIRRKTLGEGHPDYANCVNNLAALYRATADYARAEPLYRQALDIRKKALGETHPDYAVSLNQLASMYRAMGEYARAEPLYRQALKIQEKALGDAHPDYATSLSNLAALYRSMADYARAEPLFRQALNIRKRGIGDASPDYATSLNNLAELYWSMGDFARAEPLFRQALDITAKNLGEAHPHYASSLHNLASLYQSTADYVRAEPLFRQSLEIIEKKLSKAHPQYAIGLHGLALLYQTRRDYAQAEPLYQQACDVLKHALGEAHPDYANCVNNLAAMYVSMDDYARAEPLFREALAISRRNLELASLVQSERQQLAMTDSLRYQVDGYVALSYMASDYAEPVYREVLGWKGSVTIRQQLIRAASDEPAIAPLVDAYRQVTSRLATLSFGTPQPQQRQAWQRQIAELTDERERLEAQLSQASSTFRQSREPVTLETLQAALPEGAVLVDLLEFGAPVRADGEKTADAAEVKPPAETSERARRIAAFVVRRGAPVTLHVLGSADGIASLVDTWRGKQNDDFGRTAEAQQAAAELRQLVWEPLVGKIGDAKIVLMSPDGALARFPLAALPGSKPSQYLIEEVALVTIPVPQLLPSLLAESNTRAPVEAASTELMLVGDVDFDAASDPTNTPNTTPESTLLAASNRAPVRSPDGWQFVRLAGTKSEIDAIAGDYERLHKRAATVLRDNAASESAVRSLAPSTRFLHLATHGFFAPASLRSALAPADERGSGLLPTELSNNRQPSTSAVYSPGLLSGLALAGANVRGEPRPATGTTDISAGFPQVDNPADDGIWTADEVSSLDLRRMELAVLSACETGLGATAGGEGVLGLQRAFQVAGARTTITSLWKVDDDATRVLMTEFYQNLWQRKLGKLEALRQAQLKMLTKYDVKEHALRGSVRPRDEARPAPGSSKTMSRIPPYYWAAFVVAGDWR